MKKNVKVKMTMKGIKIKENDFDNFQNLIFY